MTLLSAWRKVRTVNGSERLRPQRTNHRFASALGLVAVVLLLAGCTDEKVSGSGSLPAPADTIETIDDPDAPSIKLLVGEGDEQRLIRFSPDYTPPGDDEVVGEFPPADSRFDLSASPTEQSDTPERPGLDLLATVNDGTNSFDTNELDAVSGRQPGSTLVSLAAKACASRDSPGDFAPGERHAFMIGAYPWQIREDAGQGNGYLHHILMGWGQDFWLRTCDEMLAAQELLLCTADKLAEIADSVGSVHWDIKYWDELGQLVDNVSITIPPQATTDKFVARDMALNTLAALAQLELRHPAGNTAFTQGPYVGSENFTATECTTAYAAAADGDTAVDPDNAAYDSFEDAVWAWRTGLDFGVDPEDDFQAAGKHRLGLKANVLAAAARLVKKLVVDSVRDDLAGAERKRASAGDPLKGAKAYWGAPDADEPVYNTVRHALQVLYGRLEITPINPDLGSWQSGGVQNFDPYCWNTSKHGPGFLLWTSLANPWEDPVVSTREQAFAVSTLERAGIVVAPGSISSSNTVREKITKHLARQAALDAGLIDGPTEFDAWYALEPNDLRDGVLATAKSISDEDLVLALRKNFYTYRSMTGYYFSTTDLVAEIKAVAQTLGLEVVSDADAPEVASINGVVVSDGLSRAEVGDVTPQLTGFWLASQCGRATANTGLPESLAPAWGWNEAHQSSFDLGEVFGRRISMIRDLTNGVDETIHDFTSVAAAEVRGWAGPGKIYFDEDDDEDVVILTGFTLADLGVTTASQLEDLIVRVPEFPYTNQLLADCLAGTRTEMCREPVAADGLQAPSSVQLLTSLDEDVTLGLDGDVIEFRFQGITQLQGTDVRYFHLVLKGQSEVNGGKGRFFAQLANTRHALYPTTNLTQHSVVVSDFRRDLTNSLFDSTAQVSQPRTCSNTTMAPTSRAYCVEGMQRDAFVPLANEITSEGTGFEDSWRHYLQVAHESAATADQLGRELIDLGIQRDIRQEAALEEVANLCGAFPDIDGVGAGSGIVDPSDDDAQTNACISGETTDIVFVGVDPFGSLKPEEADLMIRVFYCPTQHDDLETDELVLPVGVGEDATFCHKDRTSCRNGDESQCITHGGLGFVDRAVLPEVRPLDQVCGGLLKVEQPDATGVVYDQATLLSTVRGAVWSNYSGLMAAVGAYRLVEDLEGEWALLLEEDPVLASLGMVTHLSTEAIADIYPACEEHVSVVCSQRALDVAALVLRDDDADRVVTRVRAEDAIHGLSALAGEMPPGAVTMPMPIANLTALNAKMTEEEEPPMFVPAWTVYSPAQFEESASQPGTFDMTTPEVNSKWFRYSFADVESMVGLLPIPQTALDGRDDASLYGLALADDFATQIIPHKDAYLVVLAGNAGVKYQDDLFDEDGQFRVEEYTGPGSTRANLDSWYRAFAESLARLDDQDEPTRRQVAGLFHLQPGHASGLSVGGNVMAQGGVCPQEYGGPAFVQEYGYPEYALGNYWPRVDFVFDTNAFVDIGGGKYGWEPFNTFLLENEVPPEVPRQHVRSYYFDGFDVSYATYNGSNVWREWDWGSPVFMKLGLNPISPNFGYNAGSSAPALPSLVYSSPGNAVENEYGIRPEGYYRLSPKKCGAHQRIELALPQPDHTTVLRGLGMACLAAAGGTRATTAVVPPKTINSVNDIRKLEDWMSLVASTVNTVGGMLYLTDVPRSVVDSVSAGTVDASTVGQGVEGQLKLDIAENLRAVQSGFAHLAIHVDKLRGEMRATRIRLQRIELDRQAGQLATERDSLELNRQRMVDHTQRALRETERTFEKMAARNTMNGALSEAAAGAIQTIRSFGTNAGAGIYANMATAMNAQIRINQLNSQGMFDRKVGRIDDEFYSDVASVIAAQNQNNDDRAQSDIQAALTALGMESQQAYGGIVDSLTGVQNGTSDALGGLNQLRLNRQAASVALMKAAGADFVEANGQEVPLHLNTVYRRQFGVLKERYQRALNSAKRAAYLARLSIEQRLGVRFDDFHEDVGPLAPPSVWVDDLCSLQGVDYAALREATPPSEGGTTEEEEVDLIAGFADQYIGDYVRNLEELVEFYNLQNPFKEADDATILSMREILGKDGESCVRLSHNLLFHSDHLEMSPTNSVDGVALLGWQNSGCSETQCLAVLPGVALSNPEDGAVLPPQGVGASTLLQTIDLEDALETFAAATTQFGAPANTLYQTVGLSEGERYTLTWWDMARGPSGEPVSAPTEHYRVTVYDEKWGPVASVDQVPNGSAEGTEWEVRTLEFIGFADGNYHIAFTPSLPGRDANNVALANVQLEVQTGAPQGYESTGPSRLIASAICGADDPESFRRRFDYRCAGDQCYYELNTLLDIDTELLNQGNSPLVGLLAAGNHNYRHAALTANVVGTGVLDCEGSPLQSCYGSGFVEYDLTHTAFNVPLIDSEGKTTCFNFGGGAIRNGKALAIERFLTLPLSGADEGLISQNSLRRTQFAGRPLSGSYRLRIKDTPALVWENVEDVQLMLDYRYWSAVDTGN